MNLSASACSLFSVFLALPQKNIPPRDFRAVVVPDKIPSADHYPREAHNHFEVSFTISAEAMCPGFDAGRLGTCKHQKTP
ncbi:MAG: hypothetical protein ABSD72_05970 [Terracidiphilus sp.]|jgi:hypothetical protein